MENEIIWVENALSEFLQLNADKGVTHAILITQLINDRWQVLMAVDALRGSIEELEGLEIGCLDSLTHPSINSRQSLGTSILINKLMIQNAAAERIDIAPGVCLIAYTKNASQRTKFDLGPIGSEAFVQKLHLLVTYENKRLVMNRFIGSVVALLPAVSAYTHDHSLRVAAMSNAVAHYLGIPEERRDILRNAALVHDVGKLLVPRKILLKNGKLTSDEMEAVKEHVYYLERVFLGNELMQPIVDLAMLHHERLDGSGYLGLTADELPVEARIIAAVDVFDALTHNRPYRPALTLEAALAELKRMAVENKLDPDIVSALGTVAVRVLVGAEAEQILSPGMRVNLNRILPGDQGVSRSTTMGYVIETNGNMVKVYFPDSSDLSVSERVLVCAPLSYSLIEFEAECLVVDPPNVVFEIKETRQPSAARFVLPMSIDVRFTKGSTTSRPGLGGIASGKRWYTARTEAVGPNRLVLLTDCNDVHPGDTLLVEVLAYDENLVIPETVIEVEDLDFALRVELSNFNLTLGERDRLYRLLFRHQIRLRSSALRHQ